MNWIQRFLSNFVPVAKNFAKVYQEKQVAGTSFHQIDYVNLGIATAAAVAATVMEPTEPVK